MRRLLSLAALAIFVCAPCRADHKEQIEKLVRPVVEAEAIVGCVVGVIDGGAKEVYGFGEVARGGERTPDGSTVYEIGSMTKTFTGLLLADMAARGEVLIESPLQELLPKELTAPVASAVRQATRAPSERPPATSGTPARSAARR